MRIRQVLHSFTILVPRAYFGKHVIFLFILFTVAHSHAFDAGIFQINMSNMHWQRQIYDL